MTPRLGKCNACKGAAKKLYHTAHRRSAKGFVKEQLMCEGCVKKRKIQGALPSYVKAA